MVTEHFRKNIGKRTGQSGWEAEKGGGMLFSPNFTKGEYDHRKAERGQTSWGGGGRRGRPEVGEQVFDAAPIDERLTAFRHSAAAADYDSLSDEQARTAGNRGFIGRLLARLRRQPTDGATD